MLDLQRLSAALLAASLGFCGGSALAQTPAPQTATTQATFTGTAPAGCRLSTPVAPPASNVTVGALAPGSAEISFDQLVGQTGTPLGASVVLTLPAICNQAHTLTLSSLNGGLLADTVVAGGPFRSRLPYSVTVAWAGGQGSFATDAGDLSMTLGDAIAGSVSVTIEVPSGGAPLSAGAYSDSLVLELGVAG